MCINIIQYVPFTDSRNEFELPITDILDDGEQFQSSQFVKVKGKRINPVFLERI